MNTRRNHFSVSHPYEKKTMVQSQYLKKQDRNRFVAELRTAYVELIALMP